MNFQFLKDDFASSHMKEEGFKNQKRRFSHFTDQSRLKNSLILQAPSRLNKSISKLRMKKRQSKNERNIIKDYLHFHKFGLQRNNDRRGTIKDLKSRINDSFLNYNRNLKECISMVYSPKEKNNKKIETQIIELRKEKEEKTNLKQIENLLFKKLNSMKINFQKKDLIKDLNDDNNNDFDNILELKNCENPNSSRSTKNNLNSNNSYYKNKFRNRKNQSINNAFSHQNSINNNNSKLKSFFFPNKENEEKHNLNKNERKIKSEILENPYEKYTVGSEKKYLVLSDINHQFKNKLSSKTIFSNCGTKEKSRMLNRIKPLYDSFDDDESDKEDEGFSNVLLPSSPIIFSLDIFLFLASFYTLFYIPLKMAKANCFCSEEHKINKALLYIIDILYICDFCISFFRAYYNFQFKLVKKGINIIIHYLKSDGIFDFLEAIPVFSLSKYLCVLNEEVNYCFKYNMSNSLILFKIVTNIKLIKIFKIRNRQKNTTLYFILDLFSENYSFEKFLDNLIDFSFIFLAFHFFVCLNIFLAKQSYPNWLITFNMQDQTFLYKYITSSYSLVETLTTVGYGDISCQNMHERIFQIFFLGVGVIAYSYIISSFGNLFKNESQSSIKCSNNMKILEEIRVDYPNMPFKLYNKIYNYIESKSAAEKKLDANMLTNSLPFNLRNVLLLIMYESCIKNFKFFKKCDNSNFIIQVLSKFVPAVSKKSEILVYEGEMIEEIVIVKDGRLSLEAAIDIEEPEESIRNYFNINFQGITTAKEIKKLEEANKNFNNSYLMAYKNIKDYDNAKFVLSNVVKKQAKYLLNSAFDDTSLLDKTTNDNIHKDEGLDFLKNEPIKNEQGNYKYIKIIDIIKNENYGGLYMFMRRPSPLSLKVKSKFAELYLLPKKDVFSIAKNYNNIWSKIHKKDFHNMLSIKHQTFSILNKYIEINGIGKISPNDLSKYIYGWEDPNINNKLNDRSYSLFSKQIQNYTTKNQSLFKMKKKPNKSPIRKYRTPNLTPINRNNNNNFIDNNNNYNSNTSKSLEKSSPKSQSNLPVQTDADFSNLLALMTNGKHIGNNINSNNKTLNYNDYKSEKNINIINDNELNFFNTFQIKESSRSLCTNILNEKKQTNNSNEEGKTIVMPKDSQDLLPSTLNNIFNENRAEEIKEQIHKSKKKENYRKVLSLGKKVAELFTNEKNSVILVDKKDELVELDNKSLIIPKNMIKENEIFKDFKLFLEKIPDICYEEENEVNYFNEKNLTKEGVISFSFESIYQNINTITNMKYSKNKIYQEKTIKFLKKLEYKNNNSISSEDNKNSFSNYFSDNNNSVSYSSLEKKDKETLNLSVNNSKKIDLLSLFSDSIDIKEDDNIKSEDLIKKKKHRQINKNKDKEKQNEEQKFTVGNSVLSRGDIRTNIGNHEYLSLKPRQTINLENSKRSRISKNLQNNTKFTFRVDTIDDNNSSVIGKGGSPFLKKRKVSGFEKKKSKRTKEQKSSIFENTSNIKFSKNQKKNFLRIEMDNNRRSYLSDNKPKFEEKLSKRSVIPFQSQQNIDFNFENDGVRASLEYFSKEKKEDCKFQ